MEELFEIVTTVYISSALNNYARYRGMSTVMHLHNYRSTTIGKFVHSLHTYVCTHTMCSSNVVTSSCTYIHVHTLNALKMSQVDKNARQFHSHTHTHTHKAGQLPQVHLILHTRGSLHQCMLRSSIQQDDPSYGPALLTTSIAIFLSPLVLHAGCS